ncbi:hypothetical protein [Photobacterium sp. R1]
MKLLDLFSQLEQSPRPQLALKIILALVDNADLKHANTWLLKTEISELTLAEGCSLKGHNSNVSKVGKELEKMRLIKVGYRDKNGNWSEESTLRKGWLAFYLLESRVLQAFGRTWPQQES